MSGLVNIRSAHGAPRAEPNLENSGPAPTATHEPLNGPGPRIYLETFGCQMNEADSSLILGQLRRAGYRRVTQPEDADLILLNTCAVREKAEARIYGRSSQLLKHRRSNPDLVIGIAGCMAEHLREKIASRAPYIGLIAGPDSYRNIAALADAALKGKRVVDIELDKTETYEGLDSHPDDDGVRGFVTIQRGCDKFCTFCVVPFTRGRERGVAPREVLRNVRALADRGYKEITLLGQTVNSYRWEDVDFAALLRAVVTVDGIERIRFTSPYPIDFSDEVIRAMAELPKIVPYVHLPVQSGSDRVLERMRRGHSRTEYVSLVKKLRAAIPDLAISTDLLVGFCGETDEDHQETLSLIQEIRFDSAFMFAYSDRGITYASKRLSDDVPESLKKSRLQEVIDLQETITRASHDGRVGRTEEILVTGPSRRGNCLVGRTPRYESVLLPLDSGAPGDLVKRRITGSSGHSLTTLP